MIKIFVAKLLSLLIMLGLLSTPTLAEEQSEKLEKQKVVYHINVYGEKKQIGALRNVQNHINAIGAENLDLKIVMHGNGVSLVMEPDAVGEDGNKMKEGNANDDMQARISGLKSQNVEFQVCANTLKGRKVDMDSLYDVDEADIVLSGVAQLAILQSEGYAYIKP